MRVTLPGLSETSARTIAVTPERAKQLLTYNTYPRQRKIRPRRIAELCEKMRDGRFRVGSIGLVHNCRPEPILANGQHVLTSIVSTGVTVPCLIEEFHMDKKLTREDADHLMAIIFSQYDDGGMRSITDVVSYFLVAEGLDISSSLGARIVSGLSYRLWGGGYSSRSKEERCLLLYSNRPTVKFLIGLFGSSGKEVHKHILRSPVISAIVRCYEKNKQDCHTFWASVRDGEMLRSGDPAKVIRDWLKDNTISRRGGGKSEHTADWPEVEDRCINAWNAFRRGQKFFNRLSKSKRPDTV